MIRPALLILIPALAFPVLSYRTIVGDSTANAALSSAAAVVPPVPEAPVFDMRDEETYSVILERPLFSPSRRPVGTTVAAAASSGAGGLTLLGVVSGFGRSIALIRAGEGAPATKAEAGQEVAGWQLLTVEPSQVVLERQGGHLTLGLAFKAPAPVAASIIDNQPQPEAEPQVEAQPEQPAVEPEAQEPQPQG